MISIMTMMLIDDEDVLGSYTELYCNSLSRCFWHETIHQIESVTKMGELREQETETANIS